MRKSFICLIMMMTLTGCSYFQVRKPIIEQGNIITEENVDRLRPGMFASQVTEIMGTPVVSNIFTPDRMTYVYTYQDRTHPLVMKRVICVFSGGRLMMVQRD